MSKVAQFQRHEKDCGSSEVQISILSARINQVSNHLKQNRKDYSSRRGLEAMLSQRRHFMQYLYKHDRFSPMLQPTSLVVRLYSQLVTPKIRILLEIH